MSWGSLAGSWKVLPVSGPSMMERVRTIGGNGKCRGPRGADSGVIRRPVDEPVSPLGVRRSGDTKLRNTSAVYLRTVSARRFRGRCLVQRASSRIMINECPRDHRGLH
mgnify:CR=1 FL=1